MKHTINNTSNIFLLKNHAFSIISMLLLVFSLFGNNFSQAQDSLSLSKAISKGLEKNYDLVIVRNKEKIASINNNWGNTSLIPNVNLGASAREKFNFNDDANYREQTISPELSLSWIIFNGFSARINKARYEDLEAQSQGNTAILVENTIQNIILAYNNCLLQKELVKVYKDLAALSEDRYKRSEESKNLGASTTYENLQAKTSWLEDQSNYIQQQVNYENTVRNLNFIMGINQDKQWLLTSELTTDTTNYNLEVLKSKMTSNNQNLKNQYIYQSLLTKTTQSNKNSYLPTLSLNSGINNSDYRKFFNEKYPNIEQNSYNAYVGLNLSWNIFNGGTKHRSIQIAQIEEANAEIQSEQMLHSLNNQLLQIYNSYNINKAILSLSEEKKEAAKLNLQLSKEKLQNGSINSFNYRDVQMMYMNAVVSHLQAVYNLVKTNTDLMIITGSIIEEFDE